MASDFYYVVEMRKHHGHGDSEYEVWFVHGPFRYNNHEGTAFVIERRNRIIHPCEYEVRFVLAGTEEEDV